MTVGMGNSVIACAPARSGADNRSVMSATGVARNLAAHLTPGVLPHMRVSPCPAIRRGTLRYTITDPHPCFLIKRRRPRVVTLAGWRRRSPLRLEVAVAPVLYAVRPAGPVG